MSNNKLVVFDLDGTLNKTDLYAVPAHQKALAEYGVFDRTADDIIATFGARGMDTVISLAGVSNEEDGRKYLQLVGKYEQEFIKTNSGEYEGVTQMLTYLKEHGYITAVCSNASERYIRMVLDALHLTDLIDHVQPLLPDMTKDDTLRILIQTVKPQKAVMVGDRIFDKLAAHHNGLPFIGCLYGFEQSEVADADYPVTCVADIVPSVEYALS